MFKILEDGVDNVSFIYIIKIFVNIFNDLFININYGDQVVECMFVFFDVFIVCNDVVLDLFNLDSMVVDEVNVNIVVLEGNNVNVFLIQELKSCIE